jgi:hypothetical protein
VLARAAQLRGELGDPQPAAALLEPAPGEGDVGARRRCIGEPAQQEVLHQPEPLAGAGRLREPLLEPARVGADDVAQLDRPTAELPQRDGEQPARAERRQVDLGAAGAARRLGHRRRLAERADERAELRAVDAVGRAEVDDQRHERDREVPLAERPREVLPVVLDDEHVAAQARIRRAQRELPGAGVGLAAEHLHRTELSR